MMGILTLEYQHGYRLRFWLCKIINPSKGTHNKYKELSYSSFAKLLAKLK